MMPAPLGHATGFLHGVTAPFLIGARSVLLDIFTPDACLALLEQQRCTCMLGATPFVYDLLNVLEKQPADLSALRFFAAVPQSPKKWHVNASSAALNY